jgi:ThiF family protein
VTGLAESLNRTLLLMRDEFGPEIVNGVLLDALTDTRVALIADAANINSHAAQTAFVTAAMLMARSGHQVFLMAPDVTMVAPQPPLRPGTMIDQLVRVGKDMLPGVGFMTGEPNREVDLAIGLGGTPFNVRARRRIRLNAKAWAGFIVREDRSSPWATNLWPFGALAAAGLGAGEAFKIAVLKLLPHAVNPSSTAALFAPTDEGRFQLTLDDAPFCRDLGEVDFVSGGAITNSLLYCLARIPGVTVRGRIIEPDMIDLSNLNRNMLFLRSGCKAQKAKVLAETFCSGLHLQPLLQRYDLDLLDSIIPLAPTVVVGVDHIPTRWAVQEAKPEFLVIGATTHWSAMASFHSSGLACARCLHNKDDADDGIIPTTACVSFWAGLLAASYVARRAAGEAISATEQQVYLTPFRPENVFPSAVAVRKDCPTCQRPSARVVAA